MARRLLLVERARRASSGAHPPARPPARAVGAPPRDRKSTRLNSSHGYISYAVFCLKKKIIEHHEVVDKNLAQRSRVPHNPIVQWPELQATATHMRERNTQLVRVIMGYIVGACHRAD